MTLNPDPNLEAEVGVVIPNAFIVSVVEDGTKDLIRRQVACGAAIAEIEAAKLRVL